MFRILKKYFNKHKKILPIFAILGLLSLQINVGSVDAANTHSIDLEKGSVQYLSHANAASLELLTGSVTMEACVKPESLPAEGTFNYIMAKGDHQGASGAYGITLLQSAGVQYVRAGVRSSGNNNVTYATTLSTTAWTCIAYAWNTDTAEFETYINGTSVNTATGNGGGVNDNNSSFFIGESATGGESFDGLIDEVRIWNSDRSDAEIAANWNVELNGDETGLVGYWKLNNALTDSTSNGNTMTNVNAAVFSTDVPFGGGGGACTPVAGAVWAVNTTSDDCHVSTSVYHNNAFECFGTGKFTIESGGTVRATRITCPNLVIKPGGKLVISQ